jgi:CheY-like chemotaxis protein
LAGEFGVAPLTVRQVMARLEEEGYLVRIHGRGTFVRERTTPSVLIVEDDLPMQALLATHVELMGYRIVEESTPSGALAALERDPGIALVLSDVRMPTPEAGLTFIHAVRHRWPLLPLAAVTGYPEDLAPLHGTPEAPVLILPKPFWAHQIEEVLRLVLRSAPTPAENTTLHASSEI